MTFLRPEALLVLPALVALLLWARHRARRRPRPVTTWMLFARALERMPDVPTRRRPILRDLLRVLPAALVVVALARPTVKDREPHEVVVLLDASPSMETGGPDASRSIAARKAAEAMVSGRVRVVQVDGDLVGPAVDHLAEGQPVIVATDRPLDLPPGVGYVGVPGKEPNAGITSCGVGDDGRLLVRVAGVNLSGAVTVSVVGPPGIDPVTLAATELPWRRVFDLPADGFDRVTVRVEAAGDANPLDDVVVLSRSAGTLTAGFPARGYDALWRAFDAHPRVAVFRGDGPCDLRVGAGAGRARLRVFADLGSDPRPVAGTLVCQGTSLTGQLSLEGVHVAEPGSSWLARVGDADLVVRGPDGGLVLLQDPDRSSWPDHPSFPLLCAQMLTWLGLEGRSVLAPEGAVVLELEETVGPFLDAEIRQRPAVDREVEERAPLDPWVYGLAALLLVVFEVSAARARRP